MTAASDLQFCREILPGVSRTFALSIAMLPDSLGDAIGIAYLLCRIVDTIEDDATAPWEVREPLFDGFDAALVNPDAAVPHFAHGDRILGDHDDERALMEHARKVFAAFHRLTADEKAALTPWIAEMSEGMRGYARQAADNGGTLTLPDVAALERYCWYVAGTVGMLLTDLYQLHLGLPPADAELKVQAKAFGLGLQFVNILKDVATDAQRGICYLPQDLLAERGLTTHNLLSPEKRPEALEVVHELIELARDFLRQAVEYTLRWPVEEGRPIRQFCAVPLALAIQSLAEVRDSDATLRPGQVPKLQRETVMQTLAQVDAVLDDNDALRDFMVGLYAV